MVVFLRLYTYDLGERLFITWLSVAIFLATRRYATFYHWRKFRHKQRKVEPGLLNKHDARQISRLSPNKGDGLAGADPLQTIYVFVRKMSTL